MAERRPNVLLIFTDQQRADTIAALGNPVIRTPSLDRLTREGAAFTSAYSASPVCVPARCSTFYGQYPWRTGCYDNGFPMPDDRRSVFGALTETGYRTHGIGKCHFTPDPYDLRGFQTRETQEEIVRDPARDDYLQHLFASGFDHLTDPHAVRGEMYYVPQPAQMPAALHPTQWVGDRATAFIESQPADAQPWALFVSFIHPHPPFAPPAPWHKLYRALDVPLPKTPPGREDLWLYINRVQNRYKYRDRGIDVNLLRCMRAYYYACVSFIDFQVGRVLDALERAGTLDETLIVFTSDHGEYLGDYDCFGKRGVHDAAARVPMLARLPRRFVAGTRCETPASLVDVAPTILSAAGTDFGTHESDGVDLAGLVAGEPAGRAVFSQYQRGDHGVYMGVDRHWKYAWSAPDGRAWAFDRVGDPDETRACESADAAAGLRAALQAELRSAGEDAALDGDGWRRYPTLTTPTDPDEGLLIQDHPWADQSIPGYTDGP